MGVQPLELFSISTTIVLSDWQAYLRAYARRSRAARYGSIGQWAFVLVIFLGSMAVAWRMGQQSQLGGLAAGMALIAVAFGVQAAMQRRSIRPDPDGSVLGPCIFQFGSDGLHTQRRGAELFLHWGRIKEIEATDEHLFLWTDSIAALFIPLRELAPGMTKSAVVEKARSLVDTASAADSSPTASGALASHQTESIRAEDGPPVAPVTAGRSWLTVLGRLATLRRIENIQPPPERAVIGVAASLATSSKPAYAAT
jgi:hypothetical protein